VQDVHKFFIHKKSTHQNLDEHTNQNKLPTKKKKDIKLHAYCTHTHKKPSNELELITFENRVK